MTLPENRVLVPKKEAWHRVVLHKSWQGWLLMLAYLLLAGAGQGYSKKEGRRRFRSTLVILTASALWLCWWKGERSIGEDSTMRRKEPNSESCVPR